MSVHGYRADSGASYASLERAALQTRSIIVPRGNPTLPIPGMDLLQNLDNYHVTVGGREIPVTHGASNIRVEALTRYNTAMNRMEIITSERTYLDLINDDPRARFSLCHEIGHLVLHTDLAIRLAGIPHHEAALMRGKAARPPAYLDTEWQANVYASALLMPAGGLAELERRRQLEESSVMYTFGVSRAAVQMRLKVYRERRDELLAVTRKFEA